MVAIIQKNPFPHPAENPHQVQTRPATAHQKNTVAKDPAKRNLIRLIVNHTAAVPVVTKNQEAALVAKRDLTHQTNLTVVVPVAMINQEAALVVAKRNHIHQINLTVAVPAAMINQEAALMAANGRQKLSSRRYRTILVIRRVCWRRFW